MNPDMHADHCVSTLIAYDSGSNETLRSIFLTVCIASASANVNICCRWFLKDDFLCNLDTHRGVICMCTPSEWEIILSLKSYITAVNNI